MAAPNENIDSAIRFKRRKLAHPRRAPVSSLHDDGDTDVNAPVAPAATETVRKHTSLEPSALDGLAQDVEAEADTPNLKEILRQRKRPQDRLREAARRAEERKMMVAKEMVGYDGGELESGREGNRYAGRFVAQTGQVVQRDEGMTAYVEARLAEKNYRQYGWPIPPHLQAIVARLSSSTTLENDADIPSSAQLQHQQGRDEAKKTDSSRIAAGQSALQEIDLGPEASARNLARIEEARRRLEKAPTQSKIPMRPPGQQPAPQKPAKRPSRRQRRNSEDLRRDALVDAVLSEARLEYFEPTRASSPTPFNADAADTDEAFYEQFRREYENQESASKRKPAMPPATQKGAKEGPKGPKLGGSRSARAAMLAKEKEGVKK